MWRCLLRFWWIILFFVHHMQYALLQSWILVFCMHCMFSFFFSRFVLVLKFIGCLLVRSMFYSSYCVLYYGCYEVGESVIGIWEGVLFNLVVLIGWCSMVCGYYGGYCYIAVTSCLIWRDIEYSYCFELEEAWIRSYFYSSRQP